MRKLFLTLFVLFSVVSFSYGLLQVETYPSDAKVYIDGTHLGYTPFEFWVVPGYHRVAVQLKGFEPSEKYVYIGENQKVQLSFNLKIRQDFTLKIGRILLSYDVMRFEPREWLYRELKNSLENILQNCNLSVELSEGSLSPEKVSEIVGYDWYIKLEVTRISSEDEDTVHVFEISTKLYSFVDPDTPIYSRSSKVYVDGLRENFSQNFMVTFLSHLGEIRYQLLNRVYSERTGKIEFLNINIENYPEIKILFRAYTDINKPISEEVLLHSDAYILEPSGRIDLQSLEALKKEPSLNFVLEVDRSGSMKPVMEKAKDAASYFLDLLPENSELALIAFDTEIEVLKNFTRDREQLKRALAIIKARGATPLYDTVAKGIELLSERSGPRFLILVTDGVDANYGDTAPGSEKTLSEVIRLARENNVVIFAIGLGTRIDEFSLGTLARSTGGMFLKSPTIDNLKTAFNSLLETFENIYLLKYKTQGARLAKLRLDTPDTSIEGEFVIPLPEISLSMTVPSTVTAGIPFEIGITSLATMTEPLKTDIILLDETENIIDKKTVTFEGTANVELLPPEAGNYFVEIRALDYFTRKAVKAVSIIEIVDEYLARGYYTEASKVLKAFLDKAKIDENERQKLSELYVEITLKAAYVNNSITKLIDLTRFIETIPEENRSDEILIAESLAYLFAGKYDLSQQALKAVSSPHAFEEKVAALKIFYSLLNEPALTLAIADKFLENAYDPYLIRAIAEAYLRNSMDDKALKLAERIVNEKSGDPITLGALFAVGFATSNTELMKEAIATAEKYPGLDELRYSWKITKVWKEEGIKNALSYLARKTLKPSKNEVLLKTMILLEASRKNRDKLQKNLIALKSIDPEDTRFLYPLTGAKINGLLNLEKPLQKNLTVGENTKTPIRVSTSTPYGAIFNVNNIPFALYIDLMSPSIRGVTVYSSIKGMNELEIKMLDLGMNKLGSVKLNLVCDLEPPTLIIADYFFTSKNTVIISFKMKDDTRIEKVLLDGKEVAFDPDNELQRVEYTTDRKTKSVIATVIDVSGKITQKKFYVIYDTKAPEITITGRRTSGSDFAKLNIHVTDNTRLSKVLIDGTPVNVGASKIYEAIHEIFLDDKPMKTIVVEAIDAAGNSSSKSFTVERDSDGPEVSVKLESTIVSGKVKMTVSATDISGIATITVEGLSKNYDLPQTVSDRFEVEIAKSKELKIEVTDGSGNTTITYRYVYVDKSAPVVDYDLILGEETKVKLIFSDDSGIKYLQIGKKIFKLNGERNREFSIPVEEVKKGLNYAVIDMAGKRTAGTLNWIEIIFDQDYGGAIATSSLELSGKVSKPENETGSIRVSVNGSENPPKTIEGGTFAIPITLQPGKNTIHVIAKSRTGIGGKSLHMNYFHGTEALTVELSWDNEDADLDLYVYEPGENIVYFANRGSECGNLTMDEREYIGGKQKVERYVLSYGKNKVPAEGTYKIRVHYYHSEKIPNPVKFKIKANGFGIHFEKEATLTYFDPDNTRPSANGSDWYDASTVELLLPDKERPVVETNIPEILVTQRNHVEITITATDNKGLNVVVTSADYWNISSKVVQCYGRKNLSFKETRYFPDGHSVFFVMVEDIHGLTDTKTHEIFVDSAPPLIETTILSTQGNEVMVKITVSDNFVIKSVSIGDTTYSIGDIHNRENHFEIIKTFSMNDVSKLKVVARDLAGNLSQKTIGW